MEPSHIQDKKSKHYNLLVQIGEPGNIWASSEFSVVLRFFNYLALPTEEE